MTETPTTDDVALLHAAEEAWRRGDHAALADALRALGLGVDGAQTERIVGALAAANGRRQGFRVEPRELIDALVRVRKGPETRIRHPDPEGRSWLRRDTRRTYFQIERPAPDAPISLLIGTEAISSWLTPRDQRPGLTLLLDEAAPPASAAPTPHDDAPEPEPTAAAAPTLPLEVYARIDKALFGHRYEHSFDVVMGVLRDLRDDPAWALAVEMAADWLARWPDELRCSRLHMSLSAAHLDGPEGHLVRFVFTTAKDLRTFLDARAAQPPNLSSITHLKLLGVPSPEDVDLLAGFTALKHLTVERFREGDAPAWLAGATLPATLRTLTLDATGPEAFDALLKRLHDGLRLDALEVLWCVVAAVNLHALPRDIHLTVGGVSRQDHVQALEAALGDRPLDLLTGHALKDTGEPVLNALSASSLMPKLRGLRFALPPGAAPRLLAATSAALSTLNLATHGSSDSRFYGLKPADVAFTSADIEAIGRALSHKQLKELSLSGTLEADNAARIARALEGAPLERLDLHASHLGNNGLRAFADARLLSGLRALALHDGKLQGDGLAILLRPEHAPTRLETLRLSKNSVSQRVAQLLAEWPRLRDLTLLDLDDARITPAAKELLIASPHLHRATLRL